MSANFLAVAA